MFGYELQKNTNVGIQYIMNATSTATRNMPNHTGHKVASDSKLPNCSHNMTATDITVLYLLCSFHASRERVFLWRLKGVNTKSATLDLCTTF